MVSVGSVTVDVVPDASRFDRDLSAKLNPAAVKAGDEYARRFSESVQARLRGADPTLNIDADTRGASLQVDRFLADTNAKVKVASAKAGDDGGTVLAQGMRQSFMRNSPLIAAAVAGGLTAGAPLMLGAAGVLFGGIAAAAVHSNQQVSDAFHNAMNSWEDAARQTAQVTAPWFAGALSRIGAAADQLRPQLASAFSALQGPIDSLTTGFIGLIRNAMPGLVSALQSAGPVFQGLSDMMSRIGTGLGQFFALIAQHGEAAGQVFSAIGQIVQELLPILGTLVGAGVELGAHVLPVLANVLGVVAKVLEAIAPVLPGIVAGFLAFKAISALSGPLDTLAGKLGNVGGLAGKAGSALSGLSSALPGVGMALAAVGVLWEQSQQQISDWGHALLQGGTAAEQAVGQARTLGASWKALGEASGGLTGQAQDFASVFGLGTNAMDKASKSAKDLYDAMSPLQQKQQDVTKAENDYLEAVGKYGPASGQAAGAAANLRDREDALKITQGQLTAVTDAGAASTQNSATHLQDLANKTSAANTQIGLLKNSLDILTGTTVTMGDAEVAVTNATIAATTATQNKKGALVDATGALNLHTEAGAAAWQSLTALAGADNQLIGTMVQQGATSDDVKKRDGQLRDSFIQTATHMGLSSGAAQDLANKILGIPASRTTTITADTLAATFAVDALLKKYNGQVISMNVAYSEFGANYGHNWNAGGNKATGGHIRGPGGPTDDQAGLYHLSDNEYVVRAASVSKYGVPFMDALNAGHLATGGLVDHVQSTVAFPVNLNTDNIAGALQRAKAALTAGPGGSGVERWRGLVDQVLAMLGIARSADNGVLNMIQHESGGNPNAINLTDSNARAGHPSQGLMQTIPSTFYAYAGPYRGLGITNPLANVYAGVNYALRNYGSGMLAAGGRSVAGHYVGYDSGGLLPPGPSLVYNGTGQPELIAPKQTFKQAMAGTGGTGTPPAVIGVQNNGPVTYQDSAESAARGFRYTAMAAARFSS